MFHILIRILAVRLLVESRFLISSGLVLIGTELVQPVLTLGFIGRIGDLAFATRAQFFTAQVIMLFLCVLLPWICRVGFVRVQPYSYISWFNMHLQVNLLVYNLFGLELKILLGFTIYILFLLLNFFLKNHIVFRKTWWGPRVLGFALVPAVRVELVHLWLRVLEVALSHIFELVLGLCGGLGRERLKLSNIELIGLGVQVLLLVQLSHVQWLNRLVFKLLSNFELRNLVVIVISANLLRELFILLYRLLLLHF